MISNIISNLLLNPTNKQEYPFLITYEYHIDQAILTTGILIHLNSDVLQTRCQAEIGFTTKLNLPK